ncbi:hypothetical protein FE391_18825 [Nonomuraea sp. KC401]|uniref:hypothetical protein n=1 Tax=unclassified Nonomuraea TaxID=2593643 RepID=UPI0010FDD36D|nr:MULTISPECIES: hypothetical protein [unclassified Nonomuraea]NBE97010.1 hypothetical protein [Nonomuraea sp. K271]TLF71608.1 hypothetical protein FE391_18825 [Nonomuraea sp. KC401]
MISIKMPATKWLASACRDAVRLVDGPTQSRQEKSVRSQAAAYAHAHFGAAAAAQGAPVYTARIELPANQLTKGGLRGPHPWRDTPVIT